MISFSRHVCIQPYISFLFMITDYDTKYVRWKLKTKFYYYDLLFCGCVPRITNLDLLVLIEI